MTAHDNQRYIFPLVWGVLSLWAFGFAWQATALRTLEKPSGFDHYPATDWVVWADDANGVVARSVAPPAASNPQLNDYIRPGDKLIRIDYQPVYDAAMAQTLSRSVLPGAVLLYQIERRSPDGFGSEKINRFVVASYRPTMLPAENPVLWRLMFVFFVLAAVVAVILMFILYPLLRSNYGKVFPAFAFLAIFLVFSGVTLFRFTIISFDHKFELFSTEKALAVAQAVAAVALSIAVLQTNLERRRLWLGPSIILGGALVGGFVWTIYFARQYAVYENLLTRGLALYFLIHLLPIGLCRLQKPSVIALRFGLWALNLTFAALFIVNYAVFFFPTELPYAATIGWTAPALILPLVFYTRSLVLFGKVSLVLTRSLFYLITILLSVGYYFLAYNLLDTLELDSAYKGLLILSSMLALALVWRYVYNLNEHRFRRYFVLREQERDDEMNQFISEIPRYAHSDKLLEDASARIVQYLDCEYCAIWLSSAPTDAAISRVLTDEQLQFVFETLKRRNHYWAKVKEFSQIQFPVVIEEALQQLNVQWLAPLRISSNDSGLLFLGRKRKGVLNLSEIDQLARLAQQIQLTLEILHLLEKEKILVQETMEAQLKALRAQINPHFLFNTFNTISDLVHTAPDLAEDAIVKLSFIFRYTLKRSNDNFVTIADEMSLIKTYLELEQIRFGERLQTHIEIEDACNDVTIPAFVLQTIVENCIKHGTSKIIGKGVVDIRIRREGDEAVCRIWDNGPGIDLSRILKSAGLSNVTSRALKIYGRADLFSFKNTAPGTEVVFRAPLSVGEV